MNVIIIRQKFKCRNVIKLNTDFVSAKLFLCLAYNILTILHRKSFALRPHILFDGGRYTFKILIRRRPRILPTQSITLG